MLMELSIKPTEEQIKHVEEKAAAAKAESKRLWAIRKATEEKHRPALQEIERASQEWHRSYTEAQDLQRLAETLKELARS